MNRSPEFSGAGRTPESADSGGSVVTEFSGAGRTPESADSGGSVVTEFSGAGRTRRSLWDRFWEKVDRSAGPDGHWLWTGAIRGRNGYGHIWVARFGTIFAHRLALAWATGNVGVGLDACHDDAKGCPRNCVNPAHLSWKPHRENMKDVVKKNGALFVRSQNGRAPVALRPLPLFDDGNLVDQGVTPCE